MSATPEPATRETHRALTRDGRLLFATRMARMFAYGFLSVVLALYLAALGYGPRMIGLIFTLTLLGDTVVSLWMTTSADRIGRRRMLAGGGALMLFAGIFFAVTNQLPWLLIAAIVGVISPSGYEVGPFLAIEQAALSQTVPGSRRTSVFAWYNLAGSLATAVGALAGGHLSDALQRSGVGVIESYRAILFGYAAIGGVLCILFWQLSGAVEVAPSEVAPIKNRFGLHRSHSVVMKLSALFGLDAFAGGFVMQGIVAYWFHIRFGANPATLGSIFFGANLLAGCSALAAAWVARRFGFINTMVFTHLPSNLLLMLVPLMPSLPWAIAMLLLRFSISQMDVPTRQSYTMAVVAPDERSAAAGITGIARTIGAAISPTLAGVLLSASGWIAVPFYLGGGLKVLYDLLLYRDFRKHAPPSD